MFLKKHGQVLLGLASQASPLDWIFILFLFTTRVDDISLILNFFNKNNLDNTSFDLSRFQLSAKNQSLYFFNLKSCFSFKIKNKPFTVIIN